MIARYMLFTQVYFHKTRVIYDHHLKQALYELLKGQGGKFPVPDSPDGVQNFLNWDDWQVYGALSRNLAGEHGKMLTRRDHYRLLRETQEVPSLEELEMMDELEQRLSVGHIDYVRSSAGKSWYKTDSDKEIYIQRSGVALQNRTEPLSALSHAIKGLATVRQNRIYVAPENRQKAENLARALSSE